MAKKKKKKYSEKPKPPVTTQQTEEITKNPDNTETSNDGAVSQNQQEADTPDTAPVLENETVSSAEQPSAQDTVADKETAQADTNDNDDDNNKDIDTLVQSDTVETTDEKPSPKHTKKEKPARSLPKPDDKEISKTPLFLILSFIVPFIIMGVVFARAGIYPFGDRQVLYSDCKQQYLPFLKEFQNKLKTGDSMLYSWRNGYGSNFIAMIGYYIASPLNLLTLFIPVQYLREAMAVFMMTKIACASLFMAIFLKGVYKRNDLSLIAFGCCYSFCDFIMGYYWNTIWLDSVALMPLVALGVYYIVNENKYKLYIISLAIAFVSSYYIGYMICVFVLLWFVVTSVVKKSKFEEVCENIIKMAIYSVIALCMTLPITLTSYIQLQNTVGSEDKFPDKIEIYNNFMEIIANLFSFHKTTTMEGLPNVGSGVVCILLVVIFARSKNIVLREKIAYLSLLGLLFVSLNINYLDYIWHGFHFPNMIPYRFAFLFSFVLIAIAYRGFTSFVELDKKDIIGMCIITVAMVCITVFYLDQKAIIGSLIVAGLYILMMTFYEFKLINKRLLIIFASVLIVVEMCLEASIGVDSVGTTSHDNYPDKEEAVVELIDYAYKQSGDEFFRLDQEYYSTKNDGMIYGYNGIGQFSSTSYKNVIDFTSRFGMVSKRSSYQYLLTSPVTSMYSGVKYVISRDKYKGGMISLSDEKTSSDGLVDLYYNEYTLPIAYMSDKAIMDVEMVNDNVFITQNKVFSASTGIDSDVYTILRPNSFNCLNMKHEETDSGMYSYSYTEGNSTGEIEVEYEATKDGEYFAWANVKSNDLITVESDSLTHTYNIEAQRYIFSCGYHHKGEKFILRVNSNKSGKNIIGAAVLNKEVLDEGYAQLADEGLKVTKYTSNYIEGTIDTQKSGVMLTSIPYEKGWTLYVDDKKVKTQEAMEVFLSAELTNGTHTIKLKYTPQGFVPGIVISVIALTAFILMCINDKLKAKGKSPLKKIRKSE